MQKSARTAALVHRTTSVWLALGCALTLTVMTTSQLVAVPRLLTTTLIMGGTLQPTPSQKFIDMAVNDFIAPTVDPGLAPFDASALTYPASAWIVSGPGAPTINESVDIGVANLDSALQAQPAGQPIVAFGYSQSTVVTMKEKVALEERKARGEAVPNVVFVGIGVGNRPNGGITTRLQGVTIPFFDFTFNGPEPTDPEFGFTTVDIAREYDGLADFPLYPVNLLADANALLGVLFVHAAYNEVSLDPNSPKYVPGTDIQHKGDTTFYTIPTADLPLFDPLRVIGVPESLIDIVEPATKVIVDSAYDRTIPYGDPTPLKLVPKVDPVKFTSDLVQAVGTGIDNAVHAFGGKKDATKDTADTDAISDAAKSTSRETTTATASTASSATSKKSRHRDEPAADADTATSTPTAHAHAHATATDDPSAATDKTATPKTRTGP
jgi:hypothetical protein